MAKNLEEFLNSVGNPIHFLRNSQADVFAFSDRTCGILFLAE